MSFPARLVIDALCRQLSPLYWHADTLIDARSLADAVGDQDVLRYAQERMHSQLEFTGKLGYDTTESDFSACLAAQMRPVARLGSSLAAHAPCLGGRCGCCC